MDTDHVRTSRSLAVSKTINMLHTEVMALPTEVTESPRDHKEIKTTRVEHLTATHLVTKRRVYYNTHPVMASGSS